MFRPWMPSQTPLGLALRREKWHIEIMKRLQTPYWSALVLAALCSCSSAVGDDNGNALPQGDYIVKAQVADGNTNRNTVTLPVTLGSASVSQSTSGTGVSALGIEYSP